MVHSRLLVHLYGFNAGRLVSIPEQIKPKVCPYCGNILRGYVGRASRCEYANPQVISSLGVNRIQPQVGCDFSLEKTVM